MKKIFIIYILLTTFLYAKAINIALAANSSYVIPTIIEQFNKQYPSIKVNIILGSSGKLTAQIIHHAPYDIFMSANMAYPETLYEKKLTLNKPKIYAKGSIVLFSSKKRDFSKGLNLLLAKDIKTIAIANAKTAPYGIATKTALKKAKLYNTLKSKFVFGESIGQTLVYAVKVCDIGFIAKSSLFSKNMKRYKENKNYININKNLYQAINQGIVILKNAKNNTDAENFYNFILSKKGQKILSEFGYITNE